MIKIKGERVSLIFTIIFAVTAAGSVYIGHDMGMQFNPLLHFLGLFVIGIILDVIFVIGKMYKRDKGIAAKGITNGILVLAILGAALIYASSAFTYWGEISINLADYLLWSAVVVLLTVLISFSAGFISRKTLRKEK